jgi:hypothetical protein
MTAPGTLNSLPATPETTFLQQARITLTGDNASKSTGTACDATYRTVTATLPVLIPLTSSGRHPTMSERDPRRG